MNYIYGKIIWIGKKYIIFESNYIGYKIYIIDVSKFIIDKYCKIYIYRNMKLDHKNNLIEEFYGFTNIIDKNLFIDLVSIPGIGNITASNILSNNDIKTICMLIAKNDINNLKELNYITNKIAILICSSLSERYLTFYKDDNMAISIPNKLNNNLVYALKKLGYKTEDINLVKDIKQDETEDIGKLIQESIKIIARKHETKNTDQTI